MIELFNIDLLSYTVQTAETAPTHSYTIYWLILLGSMLLSWLVSARMKSRFSEYSQIPIPVTGRQVAEQMLKDNHITDVKVISTPGHLTDHYNPADKTVNHEVGHAVQHAQAYHWLGLRSALVPIVQLSSNLVGIVLMIGIVLLAMGGSPWVLGLGIGLFAVTTAFAFITLPVEFDASARALKWLDRSHLMNYFDHGKAKSALFWAAMTYVVGALSSLAMLLYYVFIFLNARGRE